MNVLNAWGGGKTVWLEGRDRAGRLHIREVPGVDWYFCVDAEAYDASDREFWQGQLRNGNIEATVRDGAYVKVYSPLHMIRDRNRKKALLRTLRERGMEPLEADLQLWERYMVDQDIRVDLSRARIGWWDIETDDRNPGVEPGRDQVLSVGLVDADGREYWLSHDDESELLGEAMVLLKDYDVLVSWGGNTFDQPTLKKRAEANGIKWSLWRVAFFDLMRQMQNRLWFQRLVIESWALDYVAQKILGRGKIARTAGTWDLWKGDRPALQEYNMEDCRLTRDIDQITGVTDSILAEAETCGAVPRALAMRQRGSQYLIDNYILRMNEAIRRADRPAVRLGTPEWHITQSPKPEPITGALVLEPALGLHENVYLYDFSALYPTTIEIWNISPETLTNEENDVYRALNGAMFLREPQGIFPRLAADFKAQRNAILESRTRETDPQRRRMLDIQQYVYKGLVNSIYGALAQPGGRHYNPACAEAITYTGRDLMESGSAFLEAQGHRVVFGDTDSLAFIADDQEQADQAIAAFLQVTGQRYAEGCGVIWAQEMKHEATYRRFLLVSKKHYAGWQEGHDGLDVKGLELVRRETIPLTKNLQERLLLTILRDAAEADSVASWVARTKSSFFTEPIEHEGITVRKTLSKHPDQYEQNLVHVDVARQLLAAGEPWIPGQPVSYIITDFGSPQRGIPTKLWDGKNVDRAGYWNSLIWPALERVLEAAFPGAGWDALEAGFYGRLL